MKRGALGWDCQLWSQPPSVTSALWRTEWPLESLPLGTRAPGAAHSPLMSKDFLAAQITRTSKLPREPPPGSSEVTPTVLGMHCVGSQKGIPLASLDFGPGPLGLHTQPGGTAKPLILFLFILKLTLSLERPALAYSQGTAPRLSSYTPPLPWRACHRQKASLWWTFLRTPHTAEGHEAMAGSSACSPKSLPCALASCTNRHFPGLLRVSSEFNSHIWESLYMRNKMT